MNLENFFRHWGITENPFYAEEARDDTVYHRMMEDGMTHPEFEKIYGSPRRPSTAVVFGDKGSGKTAIRLLIEERLEAFNQENPEDMVWLVRNDDLNPFLDRIKRATGHSHVNLESLQETNMADHMDLFLSKVTTRLVDFLLGDDLGLKQAGKLRKKLRKLPRPQRLDLGLLALLYDQATGDRPGSRWTKTRNQLRLYRLMNLRAIQGFTWIFLGATAGLSVAALLGASIMVQVAAGLSGVTLLVFLFLLGKSQFRVRRLAHKLQETIRITERTPAQWRLRLGDLAAADLQGQPVPGKDEDARFELVSRLKRLVEELGFRSFTVLYDRVDEPVGVNGEAEKMKAIIWPIFNNKLLQVEGLGFKLLLPLELGHMLRREGPEFYQQARLDKQNMVERLEWRGTTLYDIASKRMAACTGPDAKAQRLTDLFEDSVTEETLMDALDQMHQPRDAFKFLYRVVQEHCQNTPDDQPLWKIPGYVLEQVRKQQSQRVQDFYRGMSPA